MVLFIIAFRYNVFEQMTILRALVTQLVIDLWNQFVWYIIYVCKWPIYWIVDLNVELIKHITCRIDKGMDII